MCIRDRNLRQQRPAETGNQQQRSVASQYTRRWLAAAGLAELGVWFDDVLGTGLELQVDHISGPFT